MQRCRTCEVTLFRPPLRCRIRIIKVPGRFSLTANLRAYTRQMVIYGVIKLSGSKFARLKNERNYSMFWLLFFSLFPILDTFKESFKVFEHDGVSCFMISFFHFIATRGRVWYSLLRYYDRGNYESAIRRLKWNFITRPIRIYHVLIDRFSVIEI